MEGDCVDDEALPSSMSTLTFAIAVPKPSDQSSPFHLVRMQRRLSPRLCLPPQQLATGPHGRIAESEVVVLVLGHEAHGHPSYYRIRVLVLGDEDAGIVVVEVGAQHLDDDGPDAVVGVQELSGLVIFE